GKGDGGNLNAEEKETVSAITRMLGMAAGAAEGNSSADAVRGGMAADGAVGNNHIISIVSKGRKFAKVIQTGKKFTLKDALPIAEAGVVVAAICQITGNCNASEVLEDVWSGRFEDNYMASENADDANDKSANTQSNNGSQTTNAPMPDPDDDKIKNSHGGGKNAQHKNLDARNSAAKKLEQAEKALKEAKQQRLSKKELKPLERQVRHWRNKMNE
ncbi:TPA: VENN motif pre-toxin domain-containing protein, partial [Neisseria lactamica]